MADNLRYARTEDLLRLALLMAGSRQGLSLLDIQEEFETGRRTAERMRDAILRLFPNTIEKRDDGGIKRWHIPRQYVSDLAFIEAEDFSAIHNAANLAEANNMPDTAARLVNLSEKLKVHIDNRILGRIEPDLEALIEAEGLAIRQGPRPRIDATHFETLRYAIKACQEVELTYTARGTGKTSEQCVQPYGFLYGRRHYLVAYTADQEDFRLYSLANVNKVQNTNTPFERQEDFDLDKYAARSFGVFQEQPVDVVWKVSPEAAPDALEYMFHPTQTIEQQNDGTLIVRFTAGGMLEMCWELFRWEGCIQIMGPEALKELYQENLNQMKGNKR